MEQNGRLYPSFVVPIPRIQAELEEVEKENIAHEFYFLQWTFHSSPPIPTPSSDDPFVIPKSKASSSSASTNPQTSIILFTPLQEYKLRNSFATPYLILNMYTDLAETHGIVLLRGEITPSTGSTPSLGLGDTDRYMLSQADAQLLAMTLQKFYLWNKNGSSEMMMGEKLLRTFHQNPQEFEWQELLKISNTTI